MIRNGATILVLAAMLAISLRCGPGNDLPEPEGGEAESGEPVAGPVETDCALWSIHGYRIGMTESETLAVREAERQTDAELRVVESEQFVGRLNLEDGILRGYLAQLPAEFNDFRSLEAELSRQFGERVDLARRAAPQTVPPGQSLLYWVSEPCNTAIAFETVQEPAGEYAAVTLVDLSLIKRRLGIEGEIRP